MPHLDPLPITDIVPELAKEIAAAEESRVVSSTLPLRIWAHRPDTARPWLATLCSFYENSLLDDRLRELVRLKIAAITQCKACQVARKSDSVSEEDLACLATDSDQFSAKEQAALGFAELFASDYTVLEKAHFDALRAHFSEEAIVELNMFCALMLAGGRMTYVMKAYEDEV